MITWLRRRWKWSGSIKDVLPIACDCRLVIPPIFQSGPTSIGLDNPVMTASWPAVSSLGKGTRVSREHLALPEGNRIAELLRVYPRPW